MIEAIGDSYSEALDVVTVMTSLRFVAGVARLRDVDAINCVTFSDVQF